MSAAGEAKPSQGPKGASPRESPAPTRHVHPAPAPHGGAR
jgi:hypothetical protein